MTDQLTLARLPRAFTKGSSLRPIHYLGGKSRLLDDIAEAVDEADPSGGPVLDVFSGSGVVSARFAREREVVAVDIQEYSRVLCSALLHPSAPYETKADEAIAAAAGSAPISELRSTLRPLVEYEEWALRAASHDADLLCALVEAGSPAVALSASVGKTPPELLAKALRAKRERFRP